MEGELTFEVYMALLQESPDSTNMDEVEEKFIDLVSNTIDSLFGDRSEEGIKFFDDNMDFLSLENFFPELYGKEISSEWIQVPSEKGYNIHLAKRCNRRNRLQQLKKKVDSFKRVENLSVSKIEEMLAAMNEWRQHYFLLHFPYQPKWVKVSTSKTGVRYFLPTDYRIIDSPELYLKCDRVKSVKVINHFDSDDKDHIFYLRTRGLSKKQAILLSKLKDVHLEVNVGLAMQEVIQKI